MYPHCGYLPRVRISNIISNVMEHHGQQFQENLLLGFSVKIGYLKQKDLFVFHLTQLIYIVCLAI